MNQGKLGEKAIALVLPTLLHKGVGSKAEEVRAIRYELENFHLTTEVLLNQFTLHLTLACILVEITTFFEAPT